MIAALRNAVSERRHLGYITAYTRMRLAAFGLTVPQVEAFLVREGV